MATNARFAKHPVNGQAASIAASAGRLLWHFMLMFIAMMVSMMPYMALFRKPSEAYLVPWYAGMELSMVPGMVILMLCQRHGWRSSLEMAGAMLIGPVIILSCAQFGLHNYIPGLSLNALVRLSDPTMLLGMLAAMLYRRDMYTRPHAGYQHTAHAEHAAHEH